MAAPKIGLALSGAVARAATHIGVLSAFEAAGMTFDVVAGTSAGAIVGAGYAAGWPVAQMRELVKGMGWFQAASLVWPRRGFLRLDKLERWLRGQLQGKDTFAQLPRCAFAIGATNIENWTPVMLQSGDIASAVHGSCAVPGFIEPVLREGVWLCDGGVTSNLPVFAARALGADFVVGVELITPSRWRGLGPLTIGFQAMECMVRCGNNGPQTVDFLISPDLHDMGYLSFRPHEKLIARGEAAVAACLPALRAALAKL